MFENKKEQSVFRLKGDKCKKVNVSLYEIIAAFGFSNYIVYTVTEDEFVKLQSDVHISYDGYNHTPLLVNNGKINSARVMSPNNEEMYLANNELVNQIDTEFSLPGNYDEIFYTLEDYEDIIKSFRIKNDNSRAIKLIRK